MSVKCVDWRCLWLMVLQSPFIAIEPGCHFQTINHLLFQTIPSWGELSFANSAVPLKKHMTLNMTAKNVCPALPISPPCSLNGFEK